MDDDLKKLIESSAAETRRHFDVVAEQLESKVHAVAEGVVGGNERIERLGTTIKEEFAEVRMIKFSHQELDRRLRAADRVACLALHHEAPHRLPTTYRAKRASTKR